MKDKKIEDIVNKVFDICLYVVIGIGHQSEIAYVSYGYKLFFVLMVSSGVLLYSIKDESINKTISDIVAKFSVPFIGSLIIAKLTGKIEISYMYQILYIVPIVFIYYISSKKKIYRIGSKEVKIRSSEFLKNRIGKYSIVPNVSIYVVAIIGALLGVSTRKFILMLISTSLFNYVYIYIVEMKFIRIKNI